MAGDSLNDYFVHFHLSVRWGNRGLERERNANVSTSLSLGPTSRIQLDYALLPTCSCSRGEVSHGKFPSVTPSLSFPKLNSEPHCSLHYSDSLIGPKPRHSLCASLFIPSFIRSSVLNFDLPIC